jgi:hypothetical protein
MSYIRTDEYNTSRRQSKAKESASDSDVEVLEKKDNTVYYEDIADAYVLMCYQVPLRITGHLQRYLFECQGREASLQM